MISRKSCIVHSAASPLDNLIIQRDHLKVLGDHVSAAIVAYFGLVELYTGKPVVLSKAAIPGVILGLSSLRRLDSSLTELTKRGILEPVRMERVDVVAFLSKKTPQKLDGGFSICEWCKSSTLVLEGHHYPLSRLEGGQSIVAICPNCHREYHAIVRGYLYRLGSAGRQFLIDYPFHPDLIEEYTNA